MAERAHIQTLDQLKTMVAKGNTVRFTPISTMVVDEIKFTDLGFSLTAEDRSGEFEFFVIGNPETLRVSEAPNGKPHKVILVR